MQETSNEVLAKIKYFQDGLEMIANINGTESELYRQFIIERDEWCKEMRLDKTKIWNLLNDMEYRAKDFSKKERSFL